jgi:hypothetical protein
VTVYLRADHVINGNYTLFIHLVGEGDRLLYQFDGVSYQGRHHSRQWIPDQVFADTYTIRIDSSARVSDTTLADLILGFYPYGHSQERLVTYDGNATAVGDHVTLAKVRVSNQLSISKPAGSSLGLYAAAEWDNGIQLVSAQIARDSSSASRYVIEFQWHNAMLIHRDLTMFVHLLDDRNHIVAQRDQQPLERKLPTSAWQVGEIIN